MKRTKSKKAKWQIDIAKERIEKLLNLSKEKVKTEPEKSRKYVRLARKIGLRYNVRLTKFQKKTFCKECNTVMVPGITMSVRVIDGKISKKCAFCGAKMN